MIPTSVPPLETLQSIFGFSSFRNGQEMVIQNLLDGHSTLAVFPTGSGKSLCYQLPALYLSGITLVISPLIALMKDQVDFLKNHDISAERLDSSLSREESKQVYTDLRSGTCRILFVAPERLSNERFLETLSRHTIDLMVIDEAHCISEWGHNFRPEYLKLARMAKRLKTRCVLALTATATRKVSEDICRAFQIPPESFICTGFYRPNLTLRFSVCHDSTTKQARLLQNLKDTETGATLIYVTLQKTAEEISTFLCRQGLESRFYHAGMKVEDREAVQNWFMTSPSAIVVATVAFGMGIDKSDIRRLYHYNLPKSLENYSQEIGRAGRDGQSTCCELIASSEDLIVLENFIYGDTPDQKSLEALLAFISRQEATFDLSVYDLARDYDIRPLVINTLLTYLELMEIIESTSPFYAEYKFQPLVPFEAIYCKFDAARSDFLKRMFQTARKGRLWFTLDIASAAKSMQEDRGRLTKALNYLEEQGDLILSSSGFRQGYRFKGVSDMKVLKEQLYRRVIENEESAVKRLGGVIDLIQETGCKVRYLLSYFGEDLKKECGHCSNCLGETPADFKRISQTLTDADAAKISSLPEETGLSSHRQITRLLCGITSPIITRKRLKKNPAFGLFSDIPFKEVLAFVKNHVSE